jgi:hypothetical protein
VNYVEVDGLTLNPVAGLIVSFRGLGQAHQFFGIAYVSKNLPGAKEAISGDDTGPVAADPATHTYLALVGDSAFPFPASSAYRFADGTTGYFNGPGGSGFVPPVVSSFNISTSPVKPDRTARQIRLAPFHRTQPATRCRSGKSAGPRPSLPRRRM